MVGWGIQLGSNLVEVSVDCLHGFVVAAAAAAAVFSFSFFPFLFLCSVIGSTRAADKQPQGLRSQSRVNTGKFPQTSRLALGVWWGDAFFFSFFFLFSFFLFSLKKKKPRYLFRK